MRKYIEMCEDLDSQQRKELENAVEIRKMYELGEKLCEKYAEFGSGKASIYYHYGETVTVTLVATKGKHPIREAIILIDEVINEEQWIKEEYAPTRLPEEGDTITWLYKDLENPNTNLYLNCQLKESSGCHMVGTGEYREVKVWKCL